VGITQGKPLQQSIEGSARSIPLGKVCQGFSLSKLDFGELRADVRGPIGVKSQRKSVDAERGF
jgi:hypothetical protein